MAIEQTILFTVMPRGVSVDPESMPVSVFVASLVIAGAASGTPDPGAGVTAFLSAAIADVQNRNTSAIVHTMKRFIFIPPLY